MRIKLALGTVVLAAVGVGGCHRGPVSDADALQEQFRLARAEGLPTTWQEYAATIKTAKDDENAAPLYRKLTRLKFPSSAEINKVVRDLIFRPSAGAAAAAQAILAKYQAELAIVDQAAALPRCWFNRDWSLGGGVLYPEYEPMRAARLLVLLRSTLATYKGRSADAAHDLQEIMQIGRHVAEDQHEISVLLEISCCAMCAQHLALVEFTRGPNPVYQQEATRILQAFPAFNMQRLHSHDLYETMGFIDMSLSEKGLAQLGLKPGDVAPNEHDPSVVASQPHARVQVVEAERRIREAYGLPAAQRTAPLTVAKHDLQGAVAHFPTAYGLLNELSEGMAWSVEPRIDLADQSLDAGRIRFTALLRAVAVKPIHAKIKTNDLPSPYDGKPIDYSFDGRQITISTRAPAGLFGDKPLKLPSDADLGLSKKR